MGISASSSSSPRSPFARTSSPKLSSEVRRRPQIWVVFAIGFCCGHFHATLLSNSSPSEQHSHSWLLTTTQNVQNDLLSNCFTQKYYQRLDVPQEQESIRFGGDGWNSIHVFVGADTSTTVSDESTQQQQQHWFSQARQDEVIAGLLRNKTKGYFIDLAANDATTFSNTFALEREFGWTGLCIEPNPEYWYNLSTLRTGSHVVGAVVGNRTGGSVHFRFDNGDHGGIVGFDNGPRWRSHAQERTTVTLLDIVQKFKSPPVMDYLSLDVEGMLNVLIIVQSFT